MDHHQPDINPDKAPVPLTGPTGKFSVDSALREKLCLLDDGRLLISKSHIFDPSVNAFIGRLKRLKEPHRVLQVDMKVIAEMYEEALPMRRNTSFSEMQDMAKTMFRKATRLRASDIHIRVDVRHNTQIYYRIQNDLEFIEEHSYDTGDKLCTAIYQSMADIGDSTFEPLSRQDARISDRAKLPEGIDGIRIATSPKTGGFLFVMRLLYNDTADDLDLRSLGFSGEQSDNLERMKQCPTGIIVIGGPTGSGKSTTLQRVLASIIREEAGKKHVITVEDPPEYPIMGAVQTPVTNAQTEEERSKAFQNAIKSAMRLDPDVIMIGEVRDTPSARLAVQAAMTGHQVWTTVHANNALAILDRMIDLGVPVELLADASIITGLICQRLLKVLCPQCKLPINTVLDRYSQADLQRIMSVAELEKVHVIGHGCESCRNTGIIGRTVVAETVLTDDKLLAFIRQRDKLSAMAYWRNELHGLTMRDHALLKVTQGTVDPFQAEAVVGRLSKSDDAAHHFL
jgi:general secretion pathway protein E